MRYFVKNLMLAGAAIVFSSVSSVQAIAAETLKSGVYALRYDPTAQSDGRQIYLSVNQGDITGYYDNPFTQPASNVPGLDPTCRFFLRGKLDSKDRVVLQSFFPNKSDGGGIETGGSLTLTKVGDGWSVTVGDKALPNCDVESVSTNDTLTLQQEKPEWIGFGYVDASKASLYKEPVPSAKTKAYLVRYDVVALLDSHTQSEWIQILYIKGKFSDLVRWIRKSDVRLAIPVAGSTDR